MCIFLQKKQLKKASLAKKITHTNLETPFFPTNQLIAICMRLPCSIRASSSAFGLHNL